MAGNLNRMREQIVANAEAHLLRRSGKGVLSSVVGEHPPTIAHPLGELGMPQQRGTEPVEVVHDRRRDVPMWNDGNIEGAIAGGFERAGHLAGDAVEGPAQDRGW